MTGDFDITLLRPLWLLALLPLGALALWLWPRGRALGAWTRAADPTLLRALAALGRVENGRGRIPLIGVLICAAVAVLGLAGPAVERRDNQSFRNLDAVLLVIDASPSMTEDPGWPQMVTMARVAVAALESRPAGVIVFAGDAYMASDITVDHLQLGQTISLIDTDTVPDPGSRPERALGMAAARLEGADIRGGDVILMSDGAGLGPDAFRQAQAIAATGARLSVITTAAPDAQIAGLARIGNGEVFTTDQTDVLASFIGDAGRTRLARQDYPLLYWRDYGRYLLVVSLVALLPLFRRDAA